MTKSEHTFVEYCKQRGYSVALIATEPNVRRTADFRVVAGSEELIVEVEEITANAEDRRLHEDLMAGRISSGGGIIGKRARGHIREGAAQLKPHSTEGVPGAIVLYDNIVIAERRHTFVYSDLRTFHIDAAMYGFSQANLVVGSEGIVGTKPDTAGGGRVTTRSEKLYLSAVCVLYDIPKLRMVTYHNYFAAIPLPLSVFAGDGDIHFKKPGD